MDMLSSIRLTLVNILRVVQIALWMTIPTALWLWLAVAPAPVPRACEPYCGWYQGNVLDVSEDAHIWILVGLFATGFLGFGCWIFGYGLQYICRVFRGDEKLPPLRTRVFGEGFKVFFVILRYWLPAIAYLIVITIVAGRLPHKFGKLAFDGLLMIAAPVALAMLWGNVVGLVRYCAGGEIALIWRRWRNIQTALANLKATLGLTVLLFAVLKLGATVLSELAQLGMALRDLYLLDQAALATFGFYFALLSCNLACCRLIAGYASKIGVGDKLKPGADTG